MAVVDGSRSGTSKSPFTGSMHMAVSALRTARFGNRYVLDMPIGSSAVIQFAQFRHQSFPHPAKLARSKFKAMQDAIDICTPWNGKDWTNVDIIGP